MKIKKSDLEKVKIHVKVIEEEEFKAIVTLEFENWVVRGFRIFRSKKDRKGENPLWVVPPSYQDRNKKYHPIFYILEKPLWHELENRILEEYEKQQEIHYSKRFDLDKKDNTSIVNNIQ